MQLKMPKKSRDTASLTTSSNNYASTTTICYCSLSRQNLEQLDTYTIHLTLLSLVNACRDNSIHIHIHLALLAHVLHICLAPIRLH